jgi:hypothetical protein
MSKGGDGYRVVAGYDDEIAMVESMSKRYESLFKTGTHTPYFPPKPFKNSLSS